jgi:hypothetical protein
VPAQPTRAIHFTHSKVERCPWDWKSAASQIAEQLKTGEVSAARDPKTVDPRDQPGIAHATEPLQTIEGTWLRGTHRNAGRFPEQIARQLEGRQFPNMNAFRRAVWEAAADTPELASQFPQCDQAEMRKKNAPKVDPEQQYGEQDRYTIHHNKPIAHGGGVYDMSNMTFVTPRMHQEILDPSVHFGGRRRCGGSE